MVTVSASKAILLDVGDPTRHTAWGNLLFGHYTIGLFIEVSTKLEIRLIQRRLHLVVLSTLSTSKTVLSGLEEPDPGLVVLFCATTNPAMMAAKRSLNGSMTISRDLIE